jgi:hypothetical protein
LASRSMRRVSRVVSGVSELNDWRGEVDRRGGNAGRVIDGGRLCIGRGGQGRQEGGRDGVEYVSACWQMIDMVASNSELNFNALSSC